MTDLKSSQREQLKTLLLKSSKALTEQLEISRQAADVVTLDQTTVGRVSRMDAMQQQSMAQTTRAKASLKLKKVEAALQDISNNKYGCCKQCGETIAFERLLAQPETKFCISCQDMTEHQQ